MSVKKQTTKRKRKEKERMEEKRVNKQSWMLKAHSDRLLDKLLEPQY